jgi:MFS family permease
LKSLNLIKSESQRNLLILFICALLFWISLASLLPVLPLYIKSVGANNQQLGWVMGSFAIGLLVFRPQLGILADLRGRKLVLLIGLVVAAIAPLGYLTTHALLPLAIVRIFHGISIAAFTTAYSALVVDLSPPEHRGEVLGYMTLASPIGMALGPAIGGFLYASFGSVPLLLLSSSLGVAGLMCSLPVQVPALPKDVTSTGAARPADRRFWRLLLSPRLRIPTLTLMMIGLAFGTLTTFMPLLLQETRVQLNAGLFYTAAAIASFTVRLPIGRASDRYGRGRFISLGLLLYAVAMFMLFEAHQASGFLLAGVLEGSGAGILLPSMVALVADRAEAYERGRFLGLCLNGFDLGIAISAPLLGSFADHTGYRNLFGLAACLGVIALTLFSTLNSKNLTYSLRFALGAGRDVYALSTPK